METDSIFNHQLDMGMTILHRLDNIQVIVTNKIRPTLQKHFPIDQTRRQVLANELARNNPSFSEHQLFLVSQIDNDGNIRSMMQCLYELNQRRNAGWAWSGPGLGETVIAAADPDTPPAEPGDDAQYRNPQVMENVTVTGVQDLLGLVNRIADHLEDIMQNLLNRLITLRDAQRQRWNGH